MAYYFKMKWLPPALFVLALLFACNLVKAQDTVSTTGVQFSSSAPDTTAKLIKKAAAVKVSGPASAKQEKRSLWAVFIAGLLGGFAALLMPCIFPMLPLTVSYFTKGGEKKDDAVSKALLYGLSIIVIYVVLGLLVTIIFGADALNSLSTNGILLSGYNELSEV